jgi:hypothetical protein
MRARLTITQRIKIIHDNHESVCNAAILSVIRRAGHSATF